MEFDNVTSDFDDYLERAVSRANCKLDKAHAKASLDIQMVRHPWAASVFGDKSPLSDMLKLWAVANFNVRGAR